MRDRALSVRTTAFLLALFVAPVSSAAQAQEQALRDRYVGRCHDAFASPVALAMLDDAPLAFASSHAIVAFDAGVSGGSQPAATTCHTVTDVVGAAVAADATIYLAEPTRIDRVMALHDGGTYIPSELIPPLGPHDRIEAVAVNRQSQIEAVVSTNGNLSMPRFVLFDRLAADAAPPLRDFTSARIAAPVSAVAFDARGEIYAYDDAGEILEFSSNAAGRDPAPLRTISGPLSSLRPALAAPRGTRPLTVDGDGDIVAADDRFILTFAKDASGDAAPLDTIVSNDRVYGLGTDARGFLYVLRATATGPAPATTGVRVFPSLADRALGGAAAQPLKDEYVVSEPPAGRS